MGNQQARQDGILIDIPNMVGYFVDYCGNIYSNKRKEITYKLTQWEHFGKSKNPYMRVKIGGKLQLSHRMILSAKIGRPLKEGEYVNHINGNTLDNTFDNLEIVTHQQNVKHAVENGLYCSGEEWYKSRGITNIL